MIKLNGCNDIYVKNSVSKGDFMKYFSCVVLIFSLGLTGCSLMPKAGMLSQKEVAETDRSIVDGKTTVSELVALYGDKPLAEKTLQGKKVLNWKQSWSSGFTADTTVLSVLVDNNIVIRHAVLRHKSSADFSFLKKISDNDLNAFITVGKTTRQDVEKKYGKPNSNSFDDDGNPVMLYIYADSNKTKYGWIPNVGGVIQGLAGSEDVKLTVLRVFLDSHGVVGSYNLKINNYRQGVGILNAEGLKEVN
ncbi:hypothetical protein [[Pantoea] beijingensis]|nr:hypothetical protein [[Pantoea] beijingensis]